MYDIYVRHETIRVAVIHTLKNSKKCNLGEVATRNMEELFMDFYESYIDSCCELEKYDGTYVTVSCILR